MTTGRIDGSFSSLFDLAVGTKLMKDPRVPMHKTWVEMVLFVLPICSSLWGQLHQTRSIEHRKVFESKPITVRTQVC